MLHEFTCHQCKQFKTHENKEGFGGTGYGKDRDGNLICYDCCAINDAKELIDLQPKQKVCHYWDGKEITNWPGTLRIKPYYTTTGRHNIAGKRTDIYFKFEGHNYHATQYGDFTQIAHIRKTK